MAKYDYFSVSTYAPHDAVIGHLLHAVDLSDISPITPQNGFKRAVKIHRGSTIVCVVSWENTDGVSCNIRASGHHSVEIERILRSYFSTSGDVYWATRIDVCEDISREGYFDTITRLAIEFAKRKGKKISYQGDWARGIERTLYIGSRKSEIMLRIYEKGQQLGLDPHHVRYEVEIKPNSKNKERRKELVSMHPGQLLFLGVSGKFLNYIGWDHMEPYLLESLYKESDDVRARKALVKQYGNIISRWAEDLGGYPELSRVLEMEVEA